MAELQNAFESTTIRTGSSKNALNVLQIQRLLESHIKGCKVHAVIPKTNCTLIRLETNGQMFDFAVASNAVACKSIAGTLSIDYDGVLVDTILTIINDLEPVKAPDSETFELTATKFEQLLHEVLNEHQKEFISFTEITNRKFWAGIATEVQKALPDKTNNQQVKDTICKVLNDRLGRI